MKNFNGRVGSLAGRCLGALQKKLEPLFPNSLGANSLKQFVVALTMGLEEKTQVEKRLMQSALSAEKQRNQQTSESPIAIEKRVDRLKLHMYESSLDENRKMVFFVVKKMFEVVQGLHHAVGRWRNKCGVPRTTTANPVL